MRGDAARSREGARPVPAGLTLAVAETSVAPVAESLFPRVRRADLTRAELRPETPFAGTLFALLGGLAAGETVGIVVPGVWHGPSRGDAPVSGPPAAGDILAPVAPGTGVLVVRDHVNLAVRGPLTGRWPASVPRSFPCMTGIYQPLPAGVAADAPVYSRGVVAAGVRAAARLTPFERRALDEAGAAAYADCLVPAVVTAALYGLKVVACLVVRAARERE